MSLIASLVICQLFQHEQGYIVNNTMINRSDKV
jgi:hypothetical protein